MMRGGIGGVLFDFDGTLTLPGALDLRRLRDELGCREGESILDYLTAASDPAERKRRHDVLERYEDEGAARAREHPEAAGLLAFLRQSGLAVGIITRNSRRSIERSFCAFRTVGTEDFDIIVTRDDGPAVKPSPDGIVHAARRMGLAPEDLLVVGDYIYDIEAGRRAGAVTVFLDNQESRRFPDPGADHTIRNLGEVRDIVQLYRPLPQGKLPNDLLARFLGGSEPTDASVLVGPGVGEDVAAVDAEPGNLLLLKSDPVTFVTERAAAYAVAVNANDIATAGGTPKWVLATLLFPPGSTPAAIGSVFDELRERCRRSDLIVAGGHTEITAAVTRPLVSLSVTGTVPKERLLRKRDIREGDILILAGPVAAEGTAILAAELADRLRGAGLGADELRRAVALAERISILPAAYAVRDAGAAVAMHDVTEGGLATALRELSAAAGRRLRVFLERIPVYPETERICSALGIDPLGLIGSGSLLVACRPERVDAAEAAVRAAGGETARIGEALGGTDGSGGSRVSGGDDGIEALRDGRPAALPAFPADEITRVL